MSKSRPQSQSSSDPRSEARKPSDKAIRLGQVFTPGEIAREMCSVLLNERPASSLKILDPCVGPGTFITAMTQTGLLKKTDLIHAYDIDPRMIAVAKDVSKAGCSAQFYMEDFLLAATSGNYDLAVLNPPYVRQEWIADKDEYRQRLMKEAQLKVPGTSNLYVYFIARVVQLLKPGGRFACIVYDSWKSTLYGRWLMSYLEGACRDVKIQAVPRQPFEGHMIDAVIIYGTKRGEFDHQSDFSMLRREATPFSLTSGFLPIDKLFITRRGLRLKQANFFLCELSEFQSQGAVPFVKKLSGHKGFRIPNDHDEGALLVTNGRPNAAVLRELRRRLQLAELAPERNVSILTWYRERPGAWYRHSMPHVAPIIFNYYLRNRPKHISNTRVYSDNFYGLTPQSNEIPTLAWLAILNSTATCLEILAKARNQGSGLAKVQLFEYRSVSVLDASQLGRNDIKTIARLGKRLISNSEDSREVISEIDEAIYSIVGSESLKRSSLASLHKQMAARSDSPKHETRLVVC